MTTGRDPWEATTTSTSRPTGFGGPSPGPNLPYLLAIVVALALLVPFLLYAEPFGTGDDSVAATGSIATTVAGDTATTASTTGATATTAPTPDVTAPTISPDAGPLQSLDLQLLATGIFFPVFAASIPGDGRIFVLERQGRIRIVDPVAGLSATPYLDITDRVGTGGAENGLLGMAFHPEFTETGRLYLYYTNTDLNSRISEFRVADADAATVDPATERILLQVQQQGLRHRGGMLQFGPDGYLYAGLGDGGMNDASAQDLTIYQGKILRIDIDDGDPYAIPEDNPYASGGGLGEIWAHGLRNPWRFSIDPADGLVYIGDVGERTLEEINVAPLTAAGVDYGWPNVEGTDCYEPPDGCDMTGWQVPTVVYTHEEGCSVTGGYVYRGTTIPEIFGHYFYADWCNGWIRSFRYDDGQVTDQQDWSADLDGAGQVVSFGIDGGGELLVVDSNGSVYRIVAVR